MFLIIKRSDMSLYSPHNLSVIMEERIKGQSAVFGVLTNFCLRNLN